MGQTPLSPHAPVLLAEMLAALAPLAGARIVDGTFGAGGYSRALLAAGAEVVALDRDPTVLPFAEALAAAYPHAFRFRQSRFSALDTLPEAQGAQGVVLDIGVSSMQLDTAERGFSFSKDGPLDMRMERVGPSAADLVNTLPEDELANLLYGLGEERKSRRIAATIVAARREAPILTTAALARLVEKAIGRRPGDIHPATRAFQALRIAVNAELTELVEGLFAAERLLEDGGRLAVISFHSLEDRIVKRFLGPEKAPSAIPQSRHRPPADAPAAAGPPAWDQVARPVKPGPAEVRGNPRARSATLRSARRSAAPARPISSEGLGLPAYLEDLP